MLAKNVYSVMNEQFCSSLVNSKPTWQHLEKLKLPPLNKIILTEQLDLNN